MKKLIGLLLILFVLVGSVLFILPAESQDFNFRTTYRFDINSNGSATWTIENRVPLDNEDDVSKFESFMNNFSSNKSRELDIFINDTEPIIEEAEEETNRQMDASNYKVEINKQETITTTYGVVKYSFLWTNFCEKEGENLFVGDIFVGGLALAENDTLVISYPLNYSITNISPNSDEINNNELIWYGPKEFNPEKPSITLSIETNGENGTNGEIPGDDDETKGLDNYLMFFILPIIGVILLVLFYLFYIRENQGSEEVSGIDDDEGLIIEIIKRNDGEIYQKEIVEETGFSKAKVSNLLKKLEERDKIKKIQKGRRNLIRLN